MCRNRVFRRFLPLLGFLLLLGLAAQSQDQIWQGASVAGVACAGILVFATASIDIRMTQRGHPPQSVIFFRMAQGLGILALILLALNVFGWLLTTGPLLYGMALVLVLTGGLVAILHSFLLPIQLFFHSPE